MYKRQAQHCCGGGSLCIHWKVGEQDALGIRKGARQQVQAWQRDDRSAETAQAIDQDLANRGIR